MRYYNLLEGMNSKCIVIDVQPTYTGVKSIFGDTMLPFVEPMMEWLNKQGDVLMFVNAEETGLTDDHIPHIKENWESAGYNPDKWNQTEIVDKGYGYFRGWMDTGVSDDVIIKVIRLMYQEKVSDSRELFGGEDSEEYVENMKALGVPRGSMMEGLSIEWTSVGQLKKYNGAYLMGGGREECLKEVTLLMNAFNIKYKLVQDFIYG